MKRIWQNKAVFSWGKCRLRIQGDNPERALLRLKTAQIAVYSVKKTQKNEIVLLVKAKDCQKVFAIFPSMCYNICEYTSYTVQKTGAVGLLKYTEKLKNRMGMLLGVLIFCVGTLYADNLVFGVKITGDTVYAREVYTALDTHGVTLFSRYDEKKTDLVTAQLLRIPSVEFCSVQKRGLFVCVDMRLAPVLREMRVRGDMKASHSGKLISIMVLSGTALCKAGDSVQAGDTLVGAFVCTESGEKKSVDAVARAYIACEYTQVFGVNTQEQAFAEAYLQLNLTQNDCLQSVSVTPVQSGYSVHCLYTIVQTINL
jgi:hypothetical protein